jgi:CheY-like chemotaxis protein
MAARVLLVEDDVTVAEVLRAYLTRAGYQVEWSGDGSEAAQLWQRISPDVVILDIMLPGLSGLELLRRRRRSGDHACVIMLSARGEEEDRLVGLETGADDYVVKPFSPREVVLRVEALLRRTERLAGTPLLNAVVTLGAGNHRLSCPRGSPIRSAIGPDNAGVRLAGLSRKPRWANLQQGRATTAGLGLGLRRHLDRHGACTTPQREVGAGSLGSHAGANGRTLWLPDGTRGRADR